MNPLNETLPPAQSLDELSAACWEYVEKHELKKEIECTTAHFIKWTFNRNTSHYDNELSFEIKKHLTGKLANIPKGENLVVLDIGCGSCCFLQEISKIKHGDSSIIGYGISNILFKCDYLWSNKDKIIIGDISPVYHNRLEHAYSTPELPYVLPSIPDKSVDLITSLFTLQYITADGIIQAIKHSSRILKPGGVALLHVRSRFVNNYELINQYLYLNEYKEAESVVARYDSVDATIIKITKPE